MLQSLIQSIFITNIETKTYYDSRRVFLVNSLLLLIIFVSLYFFLSQDLKDFTLYGLLTMVSFLVASLLYSLNHLQKSIDLTNPILGFFCLFFMLFIALESESEEHSLMWSMLFPLIAFSLHGAKAGLLVSLFFYTIVFSVAATNVGNWDNGNWDTQDLIQFILASSILTALIFLSETSLEQQQFKKNDKLSSLHKLTQTDPLTGLLNRRGITGDIQLALERYNQQKQPSSLAILDLDNFKQINDVHGHNVGDQVLEKVSKLIRDALPTNFIVARWGGEEFVILFPNSKLDKAFSVSEQLRIAIHELSAEMDLNISCSFGLTESVKGANLTSLVERADTALYEAKKTGKNKVVVNSSD